MKTIREYQHRFVTLGAKLQVFDTAHKNQGKNRTRSAGCRRFDSLVRLWMKWKFMTGLAIFITRCNSSSKCYKSKINYINIDIFGARHFMIPKLSFVLRDARRGETKQQCTYYDISYKQKRFNLISFRLQYIQKRLLPFFNLCHDPTPTFKHIL